MKRITMYRTADGVAHATAQQAHRHADERYGNALTAIARKLTLLDGKYKSICDFLDNEENLKEIANLLALKADAVIPEDDDDD